MLRQLSSILIALVLLLTCVGLITLAGEPRHFPAGALDPASPHSDSARNTWYSHQLQAMDEPVLGPAQKGSTYRFTWLRTFHHPVAVRISADEGRVKLVAVELDGAGGYRPGKVLRRKAIELSRTQFHDLEALIRSKDFWDLPAHEETNGLDGSEWIIEGVSGGNYHVVDRWSPDTGPVREIGEQMLLLTGWHFPSREIY
jgi:hypothetical protein